MKSISSGKTLFLKTILMLFVAVMVAGFSPQEIKTKSEQALNLFKTYSAEGLQVSHLQPKMEQVATLGKAGQLEETNKLLDEIIIELIQIKEKTKAQNTQGPFVNPILVKIEGYEGDAAEPFVSKDGKYLFFNDYRFKGENRDLHWAIRKTNKVFEYKGRLKNVNTGKIDGVPSLDSKGRFYYISTNKYYAKNNFQSVYSGKFNPKKGSVENIKPHPELSLNKPGWINMDIEIGKEGQLLFGTHTYFTKDTKAPQKSYLFVAQKQDDGKFKIKKNSNIFKNINDPRYVIYAPSISSNGLELYFTRYEIKEGQPTDMTSYMARRPARGKPFKEPKLISAINGETAEAPSLTKNGQKLYFHKKNPTTGKVAIYVLTRSSEIAQYKKKN